MYVLDILGASSAPGANVQTYLYNGTKAQSFTVTLAFSNEERAFELNASSGCVVRENADGNLSLMGIAPGTRTEDLVNILNHDYAVYDADGASVMTYSYWQLSSKLCDAYDVFIEKYGILQPHFRAPRTTSANRNTKRKTRG